jgi:transcriptional regulator with XRE-family HTH domain
MESTIKLHVQHTFGDRLRWLRENMGQSLEAFGSEIGYDKSYLSRLESGKTANPSLEFIEAICTKFFVSRAWLERGEGEPIIAEAAEAAKQIDWKKLSSHMSMISRAMEAAEDELCTVEVLRLVMRDIPLRDRVKINLQLMESTLIKPGAKVFWVKVLLKALVDPKAEPAAPTNASEGGATSPPGQTSPKSKKQK